MMVAEHGATRDVQVINAFLANEHADNRRFAADVATWLGQPLTELRDQKYGADVIQVFRRRGYMKGPRGAPCSRELKRKVLDAWRQPGDEIVLGFSIEERDRYEDFVDRNPGLQVLVPLIDAGLDKADCKAMIERADIVLPTMYLMGYENANCIGCVKGGEGYWRAIREDFPDVFEANCLVQDEIGPGSWFLRYRSGPRENERFPLRDLPAGQAARNEALPSCSFFCEIAEQEYSA
jgi:hypothetical protein